MRSETEIRQKLDYYEGILAGVEAGRVVDNPAVFLLVSQHFPREAMEMLLSSYQTNELIQKLPPEDQPWVRQWFNSLAGFARQVLETRISILRWVLEKEMDGGGVTGGDGI